MPFLYTPPHTIVVGELVTVGTMNNEWGGNIASLANPPHIELRKAGGQTHNANGQWLAVSLDTEDVKVGLTHSTVTNNSRVTIVQTGIYDVSGCVEFAGNATGRRFIGFRINGTGSGGPSKGYAGGQTDSLTAQGVGLAFARNIKLTAGDYIELISFQSSGGNLAITTGTEFFSLTWIGLG